MELIEQLREKEAAGQGHSEEGEAKPQPWRLSRFHVREVWAALAAECAGALQLPRTALEYLHHAGRHNAAFKDHANAARCEVRRRPFFRTHCRHVVFRESPSPSPSLSPSLLMNCLPHSSNQYFCRSHSTACRRCIAYLSHPKL